MKIRKINDLIGETAKIRTTPMLAPRIAPMIGIKAPKKVTTPIMEAYGIPSSFVFALTDDVVAVAFIEGVDNVHNRPFEFAAVGIHQPVELSGEHLLVNQKVD